MDEPGGAAVEHERLLLLAETDGAIEDDLAWPLVAHGRLLDHAQEGLGEEVGVDVDPVGAAMGAAILL